MTATAQAGSAWPADRVERRAVSALIPYARNARLHSEAQVAQLAGSIREWGWTIPVLVDEAGTIIAGHGRVMAARLLDLDEVPVMVAGGWSEAQKRAYVIADNKLAENASWDDEALKVEMDALIDDDFGVALTGFDLDELADLGAVDVEDGELDQLAPPNSADRKTLSLNFGNKRVPLTQDEHDKLVARLEAHVNEFGMTSGFIARLLPDV
jgi:ParB-like chromosome segregation protein Spo0J